MAPARASAAKTREWIDARLPTSETSMSRDGDFALVRATAGEVAAGRAEEEPEHLPALTQLFEG